MKLNDNEKKVLAFLSVRYNEGWYWPFAPIQKATKLDRKTVRRACRSLKRKGLTQFCAGLWTEDGEVAGSGYSATLFGSTFLEPSEVTVRRMRDEWDAECGY